MRKDFLTYAIDACEEERKSTNSKMKAVVIPELFGVAEEVGGIRGTIGKFLLKISERILNTMEA